MKIGYQLYNARDLCTDADGLKNTIRRIAQMGYDGIELSTYAGIPAAELREFIAEAGLEIVSSHILPERWEKDCDFEVEYAVQCHIPVLVLNYIPPENRNMRYYRKLMDNMLIWSKKCADKGIQFCYHNHEFEFETYENQRVLDMFLEHCKYMHLELDTFWVYYAGVNPAACMEEYRQRTHMIHVKDYEDMSGEFPEFTAVGRGKMDIASVVKKAEELDIEWAVVEQDNYTGDILECALFSIETLKK